MSKKLSLHFLFTIGFLLFFSEMNASMSSIPYAGIQHQSVFELNTNDLINLNKSGLEAQLGRKLTLREKLALKFVRHKLKKNAGIDAATALEEVKTDGLAIAGFVCAVVGLLVFGVILGTLGIIFSAIALGRIKGEPATRKGRNLALAGLILGIIALVGWLVIIMIALGSA